MGKKINTRVKILNFLRKVFLIRSMENLLLFMIEKKILLSFTRKLIPNPYQYSPNCIRKYSKNDIHLILSISDYLPHFIYFSLPDKSQDKLFSLAKPGYTILDVGTNIGFTALNFGKITGEKGKVFGFEPDPINYRLCSDNLKINSYKNVEVINLGLGDKKCQLKLEVRSIDNRSGNRIASTSSSPHEFSIIDVTTLDDFISEKKIDRVDLIKIDVEGFELKVLKGGAKHLKNNLPILFIEIDEDNLSYQGDTAKELILFLKTIGYKKFIRADNDSAIDEMFNFSNNHFDMICYPFDIN